MVTLMNFVITLKIVDEIRKCLYYLPGQWQLCHNQKGDYEFLGYLLVGNALTCILFAKRMKLGMDQLLDICSSIVESHVAFEASVLIL